MPTIDSRTADRHACPWNSFKPCLGEKCMAWMWLGPREERARTNNLVNTPEGQRPNPDMVPPRPPGDRWERCGEPRLVGYEKSAKLNLPKALEQEWRRVIEVTRGQCGRVPGDNHWHDGGMPF